MAETVSINGLTLCHKHSSGFVSSTLPDFCKSPGNPIPYTNIAFATDLVNGTSTVFSHGGAMNGIKGSEFSKSIGDEGGIGFGVKSSTQLSKATFLSWSPNVYMDGSPVTRLTDKMLLNSGNTISAGGYYTGPVLVNKPLLDKLCNYACNCKDAGTAKQSCVERAIRDDPTNSIDKDNGIFPEVDFRPDGSLVRKAADGFPSSQRGIPGSRLDVVQLAGGVPTAIVEMKFLGDRFRYGQFDRYTNLAKSHGLSLSTIDVETECKCDDDPNKKPVPVPVPAPVPEEKPAEQGNWFQRHPVLTVVGIVAISAAAAFLTGGASLVVEGEAAAAAEGSIGLGGLLAGAL
jgi:hypothetical protein